MEGGKGLEATLGNYLLGLRQAKGFTSTGLSLLAQVSRATLYNWETGKSLPRMQELEAVLRALQASKAEKEHALALLPAHAQKSV